MPKNKVNDPITDQEMAFARQVLSGGVTDRQAAQAVGLNPDSAAYTKAKPRVRAYMLEHRVAVQQQLVQQDAKEQHRLNLDREQVLNRLWEIANLSPEMTRGSVTGQVKCLAMIAAMQNLIPDPRAASPEKKPASLPACPGVPWKPKPAPGPAGAPPPHPGPSKSNFANPTTASEAPIPYVPVFNSVPDLGVAFSINKTPLNPFVRPR
jgi:hypothetical protein